MKENSLSTTFSRVRDQYNSAVRWPYLAVILLLLIHLLTIGPFIELSSEKSKAEPRINKLSQVQSKIEGLGFEDIKENVSTKMKNPLNEFVGNLVSDFNSLNLTVQGLRKEDNNDIDLPEDIKSMIPPNLIDNPESIKKASELLKDLKKRYGISTTDNKLPKEVENELKEILKSPEFKKSVEFAPLAEMFPEIRRNSAIDKVQEHGEGSFKKPRIFLITDTNLIRKIKSTNDREEFLEVLRPYVETKIIEPRYSELNKYWEKTLLPEIRVQFKEITKNMDTAENEFKEWQEYMEPDEKELQGWQEDWNDVSKAFVAIETAVDALKFKPPNDLPHWWSSETEKYEAGAEMEKNITSHFQNPEELTSLRGKVSDLLSEEEKLDQKLDDKLLKLENQFEDQKEKLSSIAQHLQVLALDLESVVNIFPLLVGLILAGATVWMTLRLRELGWTIHLMIMEGADQFLWDWYCGQVFLLRSKSPVNTIKQHRSLLIRKSLCLCTISWIWIGITAWRLSRIRGIALERLAVVTFIGATVAALAQVYHYAVMNSTLSLKDKQAEKFATSSKES